MYSLIVLCTWAVVETLSLPISEDKQLAIALCRWNGSSMRAAVCIFDTKACQLVDVSQQTDTS